MIQLNSESQLNAAPLIEVDDVDGRRVVEEEERKEGRKGRERAGRESKTCFYRQEPGRTYHICRKEAICQSRCRK